MYVGITNDIEARILQHKANLGSVFTSKYQLKYLMYYEVFTEIESAIQREKQLKNWRKKWKWGLIKESNPKLEDLAKDWFDEIDIQSVKTGKF